MIDLDKDKTAQGVLGALMAAIIWVFTKLSRTRKEERPMVNDQRQRYYDALVELQQEHTRMTGRIGQLQTENGSLKERVSKLELELELEAENARREHLKLHTRIREMEFRLQNLLDEQSTP